MALDLFFFLLGSLNDLWRYRLNDNTWTWISGSDTDQQEGVYGEKGNASIFNVPGARLSAIVWFDDLNQEVWLFAGITISYGTLFFLFGSN